MNRLPPETLSHIVRYILDENAKDTKSIIPLTHVCRYWRESIVSTPGNWASISGESKNLAALSLQRAKAVPLDILLDMTEDKTIPWFSDLLASQIQNTETICINLGTAVQELAKTLRDFPQSMPKLRSLSIVGYGVDWDWTADPFGPLAPTLACLSLKHIPLYPSFLHPRTLVDLTIAHRSFNLHLDTLLDFLEENRLLERAALEIEFAEPALRSSRRRAAIRNHLQNLRILSLEPRDGNALISSIALQRGAHLDLSLYSQSAGSDDVPPIISMTHLSNLRSPTLMEYNPSLTTIRLLGPNGGFSFCAFGLKDPFAGLPPAHLTDVREFRYHGSESVSSHLKPVALPPPTLPALETLIIKCEATLSRHFSALFSNPCSSPSLKVLAFLDCNLSGGFMGELMRFSVNRKNTTSAWLHRVVIVNSRGILPNFALIEALRKHVPVVDVRVDERLPPDLM